MKRKVSNGLYNKILISNANACAGAVHHARAPKHIHGMDRYQKHTYYQRVSASIQFDDVAPCTKYHLNGKTYKRDEFARKVKNGTLKFSKLLNYENGVYYLA